MLILPRRQVQEILEHPLLTDRTMVSIMSSGRLPLDKAVRSLREHSRQLAAWNERSADFDRALIGEQLHRFETSMARLSAEIVTRMRSLGVQPEDDSLHSVSDAFGRVLDLVEAERREAELLGSAPTGEGAKALIAREIRRGIKRAEEVHSEIGRAQANLDAVDPYLCDEREIGWLGQFGRIPGPNGRPTVEDWVLETIQNAGIDTDVGATDAEERVRT